MLDTAELITQREDEVITGLNKIKDIVLKNETEGVAELCDDLARNTLRFTKKLSISLYIVNCNYLINKLNFL